MGFKIERKISKVDSRKTRLIDFSSFTKPLSLQYLIVVYRERLSTYSIYRQSFILDLFTQGDSKGLTLGPWSPIVPLKFKSFFCVTIVYL